MKVFKIFINMLCIAISLVIVLFVCLLFRTYLATVFFCTPYEIDGSNRPVAYAFVGKTYELKQDLFLVRYNSKSPFRVSNCFSIENDLILPAESDLKFAEYLKKLEKGTTFTIKKVGIEVLPFRQELLIPRFYALVSGHADKGLIDVSELLGFDFTHFDKRDHKCDRQIAIMESVLPDADLIKLMH